MNDDTQDGNEYPVFLAGIELRLADAAAVLADLAVESSDSLERARLHGKKEGVFLAISYLMETRREISAAAVANRPAGEPTGDATT